MGRERLPWWVHVRMGVDVCNSCGTRGRCSTGWPLQVEAGHELPVGEPGGVEFVGAFAELDAAVGQFCSEGGDLLVELVDVVGCAEPGGPPVTRT